MLEIIDGSLLVLISQSSKKQLIIPNNMTGSCTSFMEHFPIVAEVSLFQLKVFSRTALDVPVLEGLLRLFKAFNRC